jgi:basic membrane protein A
LSLTVVLALLSACAPAAVAPAAPGAAAPAATTAPAAGETKKGAEIVFLISAAGTMDDRGYNQGCYAGIKQFAAEFNKTYMYYQPTEDTVEAQVTLADNAIKAGAKFILMNSDQYKKSAAVMEKNYPNITFMIFDTVPVDDAGKEVLLPNLLSVSMSEQQSTFLAGYAAVKDGFTKLGFMGGMPVPAVVRFGYGFVWGIETACKELGLQGKVSIMYNYSGNFKPTPENQARAASWFQSGTQIIHVAAGPMGSSVFAAAEQNNGTVIGVDSDQSGESPTIITSAVKNLQPVVYGVLKDWNTGKFVGGKAIIVGAKEGAVELVSLKFKNFTKAMYDVLYQNVANDVNGISSSIPNDKTYAEPDMIPLTCAKLTYVK